MAFITPRLPAHLAPFASKKQPSGGALKQKSATTMIDDLAAMKDGSQVIPKSEVIIGGALKAPSAGAMMDSLFASVDKGTSPGDWGTKKARAPRKPAARKPRATRPGIAKKTF